MPKHRSGRHAPAFVLLFLARQEACGLDLLKSLQAELPQGRFDSAIVYRSLANLEKDGAVISSWDTSGSGPARKNYAITATGRALLAAFRDDIASSLECLAFFLDTFGHLEPEPGGGE